MRNILYILLITSMAIAGANAFGTAETKQSSQWAIPTGTGQIPDVNPIKVSGDIIIAGSSTIYPLAERLANMFSEEGYTGSITVSSIGSGAGFERWTKGETDISNASRPINTKEVAAAESIGRHPIEFQIGTDALSVVVNPENNWISDVTLKTLAKIFTSKKWSDVNPSWPNKNIEKFSPGTDSGTFDYFVEEVFDKDKSKLLAAPNLQLSEDDNILSRGVENSKYGIGYFGYVYYNENKGKLKDLSIGGSIPSQATIDNRLYPLARPLSMYSAKSIMTEKPQVAAFLAYVLNNVNDIVKDVGYFPATDAVKQSKKVWVQTMQQ